MCMHCLLYCEKKTLIVIEMIPGYKFVNDCHQQGILIIKLRINRGQLVIVHSVVEFPPPLDLINQDITCTVGNRQ